MQVSHSVTHMLWLFYKGHKNSQILNLVNVLYVNA